MNSLVYVRNDGLASIRMHNAAASTKSDDPDAVELRRE